jgi:hypothetical protein
MADKVWKEATPEIKEQVLTGEVSINQAYKDIKKVEARVERVNKIVEISQGNQTLEGIGKFPHFDSAEDKAMFYGLLTVTTDYVYVILDCINPSRCVARMVISNLSGRLLRITS